MQHRAPRPLLDLWRRLPTVTRRPGAEGDHRRTRVLGAVLLTLAIGVGGYAALAAMTGTPAPPKAESEVPIAPPGTQGPEPTGVTTAPEGPRPAEDRTGVTASSSETSPVPSPTTGTDPSSSPPTTTPGRLTLQLSSPATPSTSPPEPSASGSATLVDVTAPITSLSQELPAPDAARFSFTANEEATFACSLDGAAYSSCTSPVRYPDLSPGWHTFSVRATDVAGNLDLSPAETRWHAAKGGAESP